MGVDVSSDRKRVLFVLGTLWGENGITTHLLTLARGLIKHGWDVALASSLADSVDGANEEANRAVEKFRARDIQVFLIPFPKLSLSTKSILQATHTIHQLNQVITHFQPTVIHIHSLSVCPYIHLIRLLHPIPFVSTCHVEPTQKRLGVRLGMLVGSHFKSLFGDRVIAVSSELKEAYRHVMQVPDENIRLIFHGIEHEQFRPPTSEERLNARESFGLASTDKVVCLIGRLSRTKGHRLLIEALSLLQAQHLPVVALCAGKGYANEKEVVQLQAKQAGVLEALHLLDFVDTRQVLWASDVIVLPSSQHSEAFALVIAEAMFCGVVPVRTPAAGAVDQIDDGINGYIVPFQDSKVLASRLQQILQNNELKDSLATAAIETANQKFTVDRMVEDTIATYNEIKTQR